MLPTATRAGSYCELRPRPYDHAGVALDCAYLASSESATFDEALALATYRL
jgi:hypothetical protein